jgi:hypothetical protein
LAKNSKSASARLCVFCGGQPVNREHVLPEWLADCFSSGRPQTHYRADLDERGGQTRMYAQKPFRTKAACVCPSCNSTWMSNLENDAKPLLTPMMVEGRGRVLSEDDQRTVARWAAKTVMMIQHAQGGGRRGIPPEYYAQFYETGEPAAKHQVWLGARKHQGQWPYRYDAMAFLITGRGGRPLAPPDYYGFNAFRASLCIGHLVFHFSGHILDGGPIFEIPGTMGRCFLEVWPPKDRVSWPPALALSPKAIDSMFDPPPFSD